MKLYEVAVQDGDLETSELIIALDEVDIRAHMDQRSVQYVPVLRGEVVITEAQITELKRGLVPSTLVNQFDGTWQEV